MPVWDQLDVSNSCDVLAALTTLRGVEPRRLPGAGALVSGHRRLRVLRLKFGRDRLSRPKYTDVFSSSQSPPDRLHIALRKKQAPVACQRDRTQITTAEPYPHRLRYDAEHGNNFSFGVNEWRIHA